MAATTKQEGKAEEPMTIEARFVQAWTEIENPNLDCVNPHFNSKYSSLKETQRVIRAACKPQGIIYRQKATYDENGINLHSFIMDASGTIYDLSDFPVGNPPNPQSRGSEMTYGKRQQAQLDWGIVGDEDDDGNRAAEGASSQPRGRSQRQGGTNPSGAKTSRKQGENKPNPGKELADLWQKAIEEGVNPKGMKSWYETKFGEKKLTELDPIEVVQTRDYINDMIASVRELSADEGQ